MNIILHTYPKSNTKMAEESTQILPTEIHLQCIKVGSRLRIRVISPGYNPEANCQFPRAIRTDGGTYSIPTHALSFSRGSTGKFYYRVNSRYITVTTEVKLTKIYEDDNPECVICMDAAKSIVFAPCGHYCTCDACSKQLNGKCPMCRAVISKCVTRDEVQV
jgi:hypothetical protein